MTVDRVLWNEMFSALYADEDVPPEQATSKYIDYFNQGTDFLAESNFPLAIASLLKALGIYDRYFLIPEVQTSTEIFWKQLVQTRSQLLIKLGFAALGMDFRDMTKAFWERAVKEGVSNETLENFRRWSKQFDLDWNY